MLGVENQRGVHGAHPDLRRRLAVQQMQEMAADGGVVRFAFDAATVMAEVIPVQQRRTETGDQAVGDVARAEDGLPFFLGQHTAEDRDGGAHHIHRMRRRRQLLQHVLQHGRQSAQGFQFRFVGVQFFPVGKVAVDQKMGDFLEFANIGDIENVIAAIVQIVAGTANRAER